MPLPARPTLLTPIADENVRKCRYTAFRDKFGYLTLISACSDHAAAARVHRNFRTGKLRRGPDARLGPTEGLGVLVPQDVFIEKAAKSARMDPMLFKRKLSGLLSYHKKHRSGTTPTERERLDAMSLYRLNVVYRSDGECWLFRHPARSADAFEGLRDEWLPYRLGLKVFPGEHRLTFGFLGKNIDEPSVPRFVDATWGYLAYWNWRGSTRPIAGTPSTHGGLEEIVCKPPKMRDLSHADVIQITF